MRDDVWVLKSPQLKHYRLFSPESLLLSLSHLCRHESLQSHVWEQCRRAVSARQLQEISKSCCNHSFCIHNFAGEIDNKIWWVKIILFLYYSAALHFSMPHKQNVCIDVEGQIHCQEREYCAYCVPKAGVNHTAF